MTTTSPPPTTPAASTPARRTPTARELLKSKQYLAMLIVAGVIGAPIAAFAYFFLKLVAVIQKFLYTSLVSDLGFHHEPLWWPLPLLVICGLIVALTIR